MSQIGRTETWYFKQIRNAYNPKRSSAVRRRPFLFGVAVSAVKTCASDFFAQKVVEQREQAQPVLFSFHEGKRSCFICVRENDMWPSARPLGCYNGASRVASEQKSCLYLCVGRPQSQIGRQRCLQVPSQVPALARSICAATLFSSCGACFTLEACNILCTLAIDGCMHPVTLFDAEIVLACLMRFCLA